jgi:hypothetical protein
LLDHSGIQIADAERGEVTHMPSVPFVAPRQETQPVTPPPPTEPPQAPPQTTPQAPQQ